MHPSINIASHAALPNLLVEAQSRFPSVSLYPPLAPPSPTGRSDPQQAIATTCIYVRLLPQEYSKSELVLERYFYTLHSFHEFANVFIIFHLSQRPDTYIDRKRLVKTQAYVTLCSTFAASCLVYRN